MARCAPCKRLTLRVNGPQTLTASRPSFAGRLLPRLPLCCVLTLRCVMPLLCPIVSTGIASLLNLNRPRTRFLQRWWALRKLPGPRGSLLCGSISVLSMPGDARVHKLREMIAVADRQPINGRSTGVCRLWLGPGARAVVVLNRPELFKDVLNDRSGAYEILDRRALKFITGQGLLTARGDHWRAQRRIISPAFEFAKLKNMLGTMVSCTDTLVAHLRKNSTGVKAPKVVHAVTLAVISQTAFGLDLNPLVSPDHPVLKTLDHVFGDSAPNLTGWRNPVMLLGLQLWMSPGFSKLKRDIEELRAVLRASIEKRISETRDSTGEVRDDGKKDLLALLVAAKDADTGEFMSTELLMDEVMTFFIGEPHAVGPTRKSACLTILRGSQRGKIRPRR